MSHRLRPILITILLFPLAAPGLEMPAPRKEKIPKSEPGRGTPGNPKEWPTRGLDDPTRTDLPEQKGIGTFLYSTSAGASCQATWVSDKPNDPKTCSAVSAAHCFSDKIHETGRGTFDDELRSRMFGETGKEGASEKGARTDSRPRARATIYISPEFRLKLDGRPRHDFAIIRFDDDDCAKMKLAKQAVPVCDEKDVVPDAHVLVASHRTSRLYDAVVDGYEEDAHKSPKLHHHAWSAIKKYHHAVQILTRDGGGVVHGDSGGAAFTACGNYVRGLVGVLATMAGGAGSFAGQYLGYASPGEWGHRLLKQLFAGEKPAAPVGDRAKTASPSSFKSH